MDLDASVNSLKAASDPTRLRLLALLAGGEAAVGELVEVLGQSQPRVSRHLKILSEGGLADRFRDGQSVYYRLPADSSVRAFVSVLIGRLDAEEVTIASDRDKMDDIRHKRARDAWSDKSVLLASGRSQIPGIADEDDLAAAFAEVPGDFGDLLDIGSGTGAVLCHLAPRATNATGVDIAPAMRVVARTRVRDAGIGNCTLRQGDMHELPFAADSFDTVLLDQVLTLTERPRTAIKEAARVLRSGGQLLVLDRFGPARKSLDQRSALTGLAENQLAVMLAEVGLRSSPRRDLAGRLPGFALLRATTAFEFGQVSNEQQ
jgi:DNA-binding transcriptional ArsR family regulator